MQRIFGPSAEYSVLAEYQVHYSALAEYYYLKMEYYNDVIDEDLFIENLCQFCYASYPRLVLAEHQALCEQNLIRTSEPTVEEIGALFGNLDADQAREITNPPEPHTLPPQQNILPIVDIAAAPKLQGEKSSEATYEKNGLVFIGLWLFGGLLAVCFLASRDYSFYLKVGIFFVVIFFIHVWSNRELPANDHFEIPEHNILQNNGESPTDDHIEIPEDEILQDDETIFTFGLTKKREQEEKPSFKAPPNPILDNYSKQIIHNNLTESDNEDGESLEDFWKRADIKLSQRLRMIEKKSTDRKI